MKGLVKYLNEMYKRCEVPFAVYIDDEEVFKASHNAPQNNLVESRFTLGNKICRIEVEEKNKEFLKIFKFCIENQYEEEYNTREKVIIELLKNSYVSKEKIMETMPNLQEDTYLVTINLKGKLAEALDILKDIYSGLDVLMIKYEDSIILMGIFEDIDEHISSISETIYTSLYEKCYITYHSISNYENLGNLYYDGIDKINLAKKYKLSQKIFNQNSLIFEKIMDNLNKETKDVLVSKFNEGFSKLDDDIKKTIDVFLNLDLNLSEAAKQLYVHRNTLIYRLDKIEKYTSYDIRKFNDALLFKIAFFVWKEKQ